MAVIHKFLPVLQQSKHSPRVLSILSGGIHSPYKQFHEDPELKKNYSLKNAADAAGYYNDLMLDAWSEKADNSGIAFAHSAPGVVATNSGTKMPWAIRLILKSLRALFAKSPDDCAEFMSDFLLDPAVTPGKFYLIDQYGEPAKTTSAHTDDAKAFIAQHTLDRIDSILKAKTTASQ
ncbi:hypothetical protein LEN26_008692 [Aphanomyces euteiches]|nr:hypothetical protein AeMF1_018241 [Aphanomyces euteiches]KAH9130268.1 hypothetical protein LEN26_008692 [Aphanomyces euteiches]